MKAQGFSLIELMITISVIGVLSTLSVGSYRANILKTNRAEARTQILSIQSVYESYYSQYNSYPAGALPAIPAAASTPNYSYSVNNTATTYTITARPTGNQADDTDCPTITLDNLGNQGPSSTCWGS
ncbi:MAG: prepilin-type N-terminal cleavage/methylation domain-containing protein [Gammaproteobacteria bacterium]|nr:prepilin-type N-terminal cleavage/methylation domain-containing protein [Gammaproteobacteria bacterium]MBP9728576.1 prepilin-type N-terminal cleavage/methylation domain-containing protein [Gammaproteobacteria bacterium]